MRVVLRIIYLLMIVVGAVFALQGSGILLGSVMTNDHRWLVIGTVLVVAGVAFLATSLARGRR